MPARPSPALVPFPFRRRHAVSLLVVAALSWAALAAAGSAIPTANLPASADSSAAPLPCEALPGPAPEQPPGLRSAVGVDLGNAELAQPRAESVRVCVLVDSLGTVLDATAIARSPHAAPDALTAAAVESARWWLFEPARRAGHAVPARVAITVPVRVPDDVDPLVPDVLAMAADAEAHGDLRGAIDAWTGALARVGAHPAFQNEWAIRAHVIDLARRLATPPEVPMMTVAQARGTHNLMLRNIARSSNADYAVAFDNVLREAPWYADAYRWRASARAASGQRDGAVRDVLCYRLAVRDSIGRALAGRALAALAASDTIAALTMLKN